MTAPFFLVEAILTVTSGACSWLRDCAAATAAVVDSARMPRSVHDHSNHIQMCRTKCCGSHKRYFGCILYACGKLIMGVSHDHHSLCAWLTTCD